MKRQKKMRRNKTQHNLILSGLAVLILNLALYLEGCALTSWSTFKTAEYVDRARGFQAVVPAGWKKFNMVKFFLMTNDGTVLDQIAVERRKVNTKLDYTKKQFTPDMLPQDLADVELDDFQSDDEIGKFAVSDNSPVKVADRDAFRLEYTYTIVKGGLKIHGIHYGFLKDQWVYRVRYEAADQHYFKQYKADFDKFIQSFKLL